MASFFMMAILVNKKSQSMKLWPFLFSVNRLDFSADSDEHLTWRASL